MIIAKVVVNGTAMRTVWSQRITKGIIGAKVEIEYEDAAWDGLNRTAVFQGAATKDILNVGKEVTIPVEAVSKSGVMLFMGLYGTDADNNLAIPTVWVPLGLVQSGTDPSGDTSTDPTLPVWAQMERRFETLMHLADNPSDMTAVADWQATELDAGHILNRTHWYETVKCNNTFTGNMEGRKTVQVDDGMYLVKMSENVLTADDLYGHSLTLYMKGEDPEEMTYVLSPDNVDDLSADGIPVVLACEALWCVQSDFTIEGISMEAGIYFLCVCNDGIPFAYGKESTCLPSVEEIIHKLDNKYLDAEWVANFKNGMETILPTKTQQFNGRLSKQTFIFEIEEGKTYAVSWDDVNYTRTSMKIGDQFIYLNIVGNPALYNSTYEDNGDVFCFASLYLGSYLMSSRIYASVKTETHTVGLFLTDKIRNRIPYEFLPSVYVMPTDFSIGGIQMDELSEADAVIRSGGKVLARYNNSTYQVLHVYRDHIDNQYDTLCMVNGFNIYFWSKNRGWSGFSNSSFVLPTANYNENNGTVTQGKKFKFSVDESGTLISTDVTGTM